MTGITGILETSRKAVQYATTWTLDEVIDNIPNETCANALRTALAGVTPKPEPLICPQPSTPDARPTLDLALIRAPKSSDAHVLEEPSGDIQQVIPATDMEHLRWALLLPITSRGTSSPKAFWERVDATFEKLLESVQSDRRKNTAVYVAFDHKDPVLDTPEAQSRLQELLSALDVHLVRLPPMFQGNICWIWAHLAAEAVARGTDLFVLLGDDVHMLTNHWQQAVEQEFASVSQLRDKVQETGLPFGFACIAIRDASYPGFPTFPVMHKLHMTIFEGQLFPEELRNQHGDPFLFEIYRRWGASRFAGPDALLNNTVGGPGAARYSKHKQVIWRGDLLTHAIDTASRWLSTTSTTSDTATVNTNSTDYTGFGAPQKNGTAKYSDTAKRVPCLDVVIPTYRCDLGKLRQLMALDCEEPVSLNTIVVVDRPDAGNLDDIKALESYKVDRVVRVFVMDQNQGAAQARNTGLAQSFGDHAILLDDDVIPGPDLVSAYLGAIARHPHAAELPAPKSMMEEALMKCGICFFYGIAERRPQVPWGVTANLCVKSRGNERVWFNRHVFPFSGGGEDVDYCIRLRRDMHAPLVAVPAARVSHPFWPRPLKQIAGWASGDVRCFDTLPNIGFRAPPNWAEFSFAAVLFAWILPTVISVSKMLLNASEASEFEATYGGAVGNWDSLEGIRGWFGAKAWWAVMALVVEVAMLCAVNVQRAAYVPAGSPHKKSARHSSSADPSRRSGIYSARNVMVSLLATVPPMLQDVVRLGSKLRRLQLQQLCKSFDWMDGTSAHVPATQLTLLLKLTLTLCCVGALERGNGPMLRGCFGVGAAVMFAFWVALQGNMHVKTSTQQNRSSQGCTRRLKPLPLRMFTPPPTALNPHPAQVTPFVVLATQRTGSNMLCGYLNGVPGVAMHNELFNEKGVFTHVGKWNLPTTCMHERDAAPGEFLVQALSIDPLQKSPPPGTGASTSHGDINSQQGGGAVGFKLFPEHIRRSDKHAEVAERVLKDPRVKKVILVRENRLAVAVSKLRAASTGSFTKECLEDVKVSLGVADFQQFIDSYDAYYQYLSDMTRGQNVLKLKYEDLLEDPMSEVQKVCELLGVPAPLTLPKQLFEQQTSGDLHKALTASSWRSLYAAFKHTPREVDFNAKTKAQDAVVVVPDMLSWEDDMNVEERKDMLTGQRVAMSGMFNTACGREARESVLKRNTPAPAMTVHARRPHAMSAAATTPAAGSKVLRL